MNIGVFAYGRAGCRIAEKIKKWEKRSRVSITQFTAGIDTSQNQLATLDRIDENWQILYGTQRFEGKGTRADLEPAVTAANQCTENIINRVAVNTTVTGDVDAFLVIGSLGGGTGGGGAPICATALGQHDPDTPVYGVGVLPSRHEPDLFTLNAARSIQAFTRETDTLFLIDNDHLNIGLPKFHPEYSDDDTPSDAFDDVNDEIARILHTIFAADERDASANAPGTIVDTDTIIDVLGSGGLSTFCYAGSSLPRTAYPGVRGVFWRGITALTPGGDDRNDGVPSPESLLPRVMKQDAALFPVDPTTTSRSLHLLISPEKHITAEDVVEAADYVAENTSTDYRVVKASPERGKRIGVVSVCSGIGVPQRITNIQSEANTIATRILEKQKQNPNPKDVDIFTDDQTGVPSSF